MAETTTRPTARLVAGAWIAILAGVALLLGAWAVGPYGLATVMAPAGWLGIVSGLGLTAWASVRKARNSDLRG